MARKHRCVPVCACSLRGPRVRMLAHVHVSPVCMRVCACARVRVLVDLMCASVVGVHLVLWRGGGNRGRREDEEEPQVQESLALGRCAHSVP